MIVKKDGSHSLTGESLLSQQRVSTRAFPATGIHDMTLKLTGRHAGLGEGGKTT